jgi:organic hydroperoxide reductase OsmC/OhrA
VTSYPLQFEAVTEMENSQVTEWQSRSQDHVSRVSIPPEFEGPGGALSPEDLFNQALANCFVATFKVFAEKSRLSFEKLEVSSRLVVDLDENKKPVMKEFFLEARIHSPTNAEKAMLLARKASQSGFILNSVKTLCHFTFEIQPKEVS